MDFKIVITAKARIDTLHGIEWYNQLTPDLGKRFYQAIESKYKILCQNPYFQIRYEDVRCIPLEAFPYMVHFVVEEKHERIVVLGVICTHRDPKIRAERTK